MVCRPRRNQDRAALRRGQALFMDARTNRRGANSQSLQPDKNIAVSQYSSDTYGTPLYRCPPRLEKGFSRHGKQENLIFCAPMTPHSSFPPSCWVRGTSLDMDLTLFFTLSGLNIIRRGYAEKIQLAGAPATLPKFIAVAKENGARLIACSAAFPILGIKGDDFIEGVDFGGVAEFVSLAEEADVVLTFC